jgi:hypothetical protein
VEVVKTFSSFAHVKTLKIRFSLSFTSLSLIFLHSSPVHSATFQTQRPFLEVPRRVTLRRGAATVRPKTFSLLAKQDSRCAMVRHAERQRERERQDCASALLRLVMLNIVCNGLF